MKKLSFLPILLIITVLLSNTVYANEGVQETSESPALTLSAKSGFLIEQKTGAAEFHSTARITRSAGMNFSHPRVSFAVSPSDEGRISLSDRAIVSQLVNNRL